MEFLQPKDLLLIYAAAIFAGLILLVRRRPRRGMRLNLRGRVQGPPAASRGNEVVAHPNAAGPARELNVVFNYNGHSWDAFEVLGLPAGSPLDKVEQAYHQELSRADRSSHAFLAAAYQAIQNKKAG